MQIEEGSTRRIFLENRLWKTLCIFRKTDYRVIMIQCTGYDAKKFDPFGLSDKKSERNISNHLVTVTILCDFPKVIKKITVKGKNIYFTKYSRWRQLTVE